MILSDNQERVLQAIINDPYANNADIAMRCHMGIQTQRGVMKQLYAMYNISPELSWSKKKPALLEAVTLSQGVKTVNMTIADEYALKQASELLQAVMGVDGFINLQEDMMNEGETHMYVLFSEYEEIISEFEDVRKKITNK